MMPMDDSVENIVAAPLLKRIRRDPAGLNQVVIQIDTQRDYGPASRKVQSMVTELLEKASRSEQHILNLGDEHSRNIYARLQGESIEKLVHMDRPSPDAPEAVISAIRLDLDDSRYFNPDNLIRTVISVPLLRKLKSDEEGVYDVQIEVNFNCADGRPKAKSRMLELIKDAIKGTPSSEPSDSASSPKSSQLVNEWKTALSDQYVYATLSGRAIQLLVELDEKEHTSLQSQQPKDEAKKDWHTIYHIWPDFKLRAQIWRSVATVKADACRRSFATTGRNIVWAILDSGILGTHKHFEMHGNLIPPNGLAHMDFTGPNLVEVQPDQLTDDYGHGTHVAGIIAGELDETKYRAVCLSRERDQAGKISFKGEVVSSPVMGVAPECKLLSYKVLDRNGEGNVSTVIAAIQTIQQLNGFGRNIIIHGMNMSLGYDFDPEWFACGQSPICVEVDRLVRSGVAVVIAAGNTGKGFALTINDPGNAQLAVTVGATHRDMPHRYGVSYFSSKGPTADGRSKPDLLAPGERIISCGAGPDLTTYLKMAGGPLPAEPGKDDAYYLERSGTSMAAPHVSGIIAGILSTRLEFVGLPEELKDLLIKNAIDLGREKSFQGGGLVDMMKTIQAM
jgi:serine protease AprX